MEAAPLVAPLLPRGGGGDTPFFQGAFDVGTLGFAQAVDAGRGLRGVAVAQDFLEIVERFGGQDGELAVAQPGVARAHLEQTLDFPGGEAFAAAAVERDFHLEPVLARAAHGDFRGDDFDLLADVGEARADRDLPAGELLQAGHPQREEAQDACPRRAGSSGRWCRGR